MSVTPLPYVHPQQRALDARMAALHRLVIAYHACQSNESANDTSHTEEFEDAADDFCMAHWRLTEIEGNAS